MEKEIVTIQHAVCIRKNTHDNTYPLGSGGEIGISPLLEAGEEGLCPTPAEQSKENIRNEMTKPKTMAWKLFLFLLATGMAGEITPLFTMDHSGHSNHFVDQKKESTVQKPRETPKTIATTLSIAEQEKTPSGDIRVAALLTDDQSQPIGFAPIQFILSTSFGELNLGSKPTDADGLAKTTVSGKIRRGSFSLMARYKGVSSYGPSQAQGELVFPPPKVPTGSSLRPVFPVLVPFAKGFEGLFPETVQTEINRVPHASLITPYPSLLLVTALMIVFFSIWSIFFYVISLVWWIKKSSKT
jgi:hypothetical protein